MTVKALILAGGLLGMAATGSTALAATGTSGSSTHQKTASSEQNLRHVTIKVDAVDPTNHIVKFEAQVSPEAKVEHNGTPIKLDQLKAGDEVRAAFDPKTGEIMKIDVKKGQARETQPSSGGANQ